MKRGFLALFAGLLLTQPLSAAPVADLTFKDIRDNSRSLSEFRDAKGFVLAFLGCECPINTAIMPTLTKLADDFDAQGVVFIGIYSNMQDSLADVTEHSRKHHVKFIVTKDFDAKLANLLEAKRTPEFVVLDAKRVIQYRGRIDDQFGYTKNGQSFSRTAPTKNDLRDAITAMLDGKETPTTEVLGCLIGREKKTKDSQITWAQHVAPILFQHCASCHRPGEIGPFSLLTYDDAQGWGEMIREVVQEHRMPPWHADPTHGKYANDRSLSADEIQTISRWVDAGMPSGDLSKAPPAPKFADGWGIGKPDLVFTMPKAFNVPAKGTIDYQNFTINTQLKEDTWISAVEIRPGTHAVVHHVIMYVIPPGQNRADENREAGFFAAYAPGHNPAIFPKGYGKMIPKGARIIFQMHYTTNGTAATDQTSVGLITSKEPLKEIETLGIANPQLYLPPGKADVEILAMHRLTQDIRLFSMMPHTHLRGKAFRYEVEYPDGKKEVLLNVPRYDFGWQTTYVLAEPKSLPKGATITCTGIYDNSVDNPNNPNPKQAVKWGKQTWEEMMIGYFDYLPSTNKPEPSGGAEGQTRRRVFVLGIYKTYDKNMDEVITPDEVPEGLKPTYQRLLDRYDANKDGKLAKSEIPGLD